MDFYAYQAAARRQSRVFVVMFMAAVAVVVIALDAVICTALAARSGVASPVEFAKLHPDTVFLTSVLHHRRHRAREPLQIRAAARRRRRWSLSP